MNYIKNIDNGFHGIFFYFKLMTNFFDYKWD